MNIPGCEGRLASLPEILDRREQRAQQQMALLQQGPCVVSFSMNIPGALKAFPLAAAGFEEGLSQIRKAIPETCQLNCLRSGGIAGEEPFDAVTRQYNETMERLLPVHGVEFCQIPRTCLGDEPISASRVRKLLADNGGVTDEIRRMVPPCTAEYLTEKYGEAAR